MTELKDLNNSLKKQNDILERIAKSLEKMVLKDEIDMLSKDEKPVRREVKCPY